MKLRAFSQSMSGFTILELLVVLAIIGILSSLALPNYLCYRDRVRQAEAVNALGAIRDHQTDYYNLNEAFTSNFNDLGFYFEGLSSEGEVRGGGYGDYSSTYGKYFKYFLWSTDEPHGKKKGWYKQGKIPEFNQGFEAWTSCSNLYFGDGAEQQDVIGCMCCLWYIDEDGELCQLTLDNFLE